MPRSAVVPRRRAVLRAACEVLLPAGAGSLPGAVDAGVPEAIEQALEKMPARRRRLVGALVTSWDLGPVVHPRFRRRFHKLSPQKRTAWVQWVTGSRRQDLKMAFFYLKQLVFLFYASSEEVEGHLGYDYTCRRDGEVHGAPVRRGV